MDNEFNIIITVKPNKNSIISDEEKYECMVDIYYRMQGYHTEGVDILNKGDVSIKLDPNSLNKNKRSNKIKKIINNIIKNKEK